LKKYKNHAETLPELRRPANPMKRYFNYEDKIVMFSPFSYSPDKEKVSGFNDEEHFLIGGKNKVIS
jgi:hypothetical protein